MMEKEIKFCALKAQIQLLDELISLNEERISNIKNINDDMDMNGFTPHDIEIIKVFNDTWYKCSLSVYEARNKTYIRFKNRLNKLLEETKLWNDEVTVNKVKELPSIDNVTTELLASAFANCGIEVRNYRTIDQIIDIVELLEHKGENTTLGDLDALKEEWNKIW